MGSVVFIFNPQVCDGVRGVHVLPAGLWWGPWCSSFTRRFVMGSVVFIVYPQVCDEVRGVHLLPAGLWWGPWCSFFQWSALCFVCFCLSSPWIVHQWFLLRFSLTLFRLVPTAEIHKFIFLFWFTVIRTGGRCNEMCLEYLIGKLRTSILHHSLLMLICLLNFYIRWPRFSAPLLNIWIIRN